MRRSHLVSITLAGLLVAALTLIGISVAAAAPGLAIPPSAVPVFGSPVDPLALTAAQAELTASDGMANDYFGISVAVSGDTAVVGEPYAGDYNGVGTAYIFVHSGGGWTQQAELTASDAAGHDWFGISVAISGDTVLVGKLGGAAYVFTRSGTSWTQQAQLTAAGAADDRFGMSVAISGETALVGAPWGPAAYVFTRSGTSWSQQAELTPTGGATGWFGQSVALSGDTALVGAFHDTVGANADQGSAYVFTRSGTSWTQQAKLLAADGSAGDEFGWSVAISGDTALVGPQYYSVPWGPHQGSAYVFVRSGTSWSQQAQLLAADGMPYDQFGYAVALSGDTALVGAPWQGGNGNPADHAHGAAYVFTRSGTSWIQQARLAVAGGSLNPWLGASVALSNGTALVGAPHDNVGSPAEANQGSAYVFVLDSTPPTTTLHAAPPANAAGWNNSAVTVTLDATDNAGGLGVAATHYEFGSGADTAYSAPFAISAEGSTTIHYWSVDAAGNVEAAKTAAVRIDTHKPTSTAGKNLTVAKGKKVTLPFKISDPLPSCGKAAVTITIKRGAGAVKTIQLTNVPTNVAQTYTCNVTLPKGSYKWTVKATDIAGNAGTVSAAKKLVVT